MRKPNRAASLLLGVAALLAAFGGAGCGDKAAEGEGGSTSGNDAAKYMGGPPPGAQQPAGARGNTPAPTGSQAAPPGPQGAASGGQGR